jgi:hypothetical protein
MASLYPWAISSQSTSSILTSFVSPTQHPHTTKKEDSNNDEIRSGFISREMFHLKDNELIINSLK